MEHFHLDRKSLSFFFLPINNIFTLEVSSKPSSGFSQEYYISGRTLKFVGPAYLLMLSTNFSFYFVLLYDVKLSCSKDRV